MLCIFHEWFNFENYPKFELGQWCTYVHAKSLQLCLTICNPENCSPPGSSVHGILQTRVMEWVALPSSRGSSWCRNQTRVSCLLHWQAGSLPLVFFFKALIHNVSEFTGPTMTDLQLPTMATLNQDLGRVHSCYCKPKNWLRVLILFKHLFQKSGPAPRR